MRDVFDESCRKYENTHLWSITFFSENCTLCETMSKNVAETNWPQTTSQHGAYALHAV
jgi:hypothetical protein